jgi:hypothetical protein
LDGSGLVGTGLKRVDSSMSFFQIFLSAPVLDPPVLMSYGFDGFKYESDRDESRRQIPRVGFLRRSFFNVNGDIAYLALYSV